MIPFEEAGGLGMGCWQLGGASSFGGRVNGYGALSDDQAIATVHAAIDHGIRFFDTADSYGRGRSEELLGRALRGRRDQAVICSQFGAREDVNGHAFHDLSATHLEKALDATLARLGADHLDVLLLHGPPDDMDMRTYDREPFEALVRTGRLRAYGTSVRSVHGAKNVAKAGFGSFIEMIVNVLDRRGEVDVFRLARANGQRIIARVPLASGFLSERSLKERPSFPPDDIRSTFPADQVAWTLDAVRSLAFLNDEPGGLSSSALRFCAHHPDVYVTIPGMRDPEQVLRNVQAVRRGPLPHRSIERIAEAVPNVFPKWR